MGLIKASLDSLRQSVGDQFLEVVSCPEVDNDVIVQRGVISHGSGNKTFTEGVISNGSAVIVPQGMAMMIVDNGKVVEFSAEPGTFKYESSSEPSVFCGGLGKGLIDTIKTIGQRITYGGQAAKDQRVYYINIKVIPGIPFGSKTRKPIVDSVYGNVEIGYNGEFSIKVDDPVILVNTMLGSNPKDTLTFDDIFASGAGNILRDKFSEKVIVAIGELMVNEKVSYEQISTRTSEVSDKMNVILNEDWYQKYGIIVTEVAIDINLSEESMAQVREISKVRGMGNAEADRVRAMGKAYEETSGAMQAAAGEALLNASKNEGGALGGFVGMGMANNAGAGILGAVAGTQAAQPTQTTENAQPTETQGAGKFCTNCGQPVSGNFCGNCGTKVE